MTDFCVRDGNDSRFPNQMLPINKDDSDYNVINHCRWDKLSDILPSLIFNKTFSPYVLDNFYANNVGAMPILYKLA